MVRILDRYRNRFDFEWRDRPLGRIAACIAVGLCLFVPLVTPSRSEARAGGPGALFWLIAAQNKNGGYGTEPGADSSVGMTGWAMLGLEAAGVNPLDIRRAGNTPVAYLRRNAAAITSTGDLERTIIALVGAGGDPRSFAGRDLVAELRDRRKRDGSFQQQVNLTAFAILAQKAAKVDRSKLGKSAQWLRRAQNRNGGWGSTVGAASEPDSTGAVMQALAVAPGGKGRVKKAALDWLRSAQHGTGGWSLVRGASSNTQSTAWAVQGILAAGKNPSSFRPKGTNPYKYLKRRQRSDGHYEYSSASDQTPVWATAQGLAAAYSAEFPIKPVKRAPKPAKDGNGGGGSSGGGGGGNYDSGYDGSSGYGDSGLGLGDLYNAGGGTGGTGGGRGDRPASSGPVSEDEAPAAATNRERIAANPDDANAMTDQEASSEEPSGEDTFEAPATPVLLGGLGGLTTLLGVGFIWFRRRLP